MDEKTHFLKFWNKEAAATRDGAVADSRGLRLPPGSQVAHRARDRLAHRARGDRCSPTVSRRACSNGPRRQRPATMKEVLDTYDRSSRRARPGSSRPPTPRTGQRQVPFMFQGQQVMNETGLREGVGISARHHSSPRPALHVSAADGVDGAGRSTGRAPTSRCERGPLSVELAECCPSCAVPVLGGP